MITIRCTVPETMVINAGPTSLVPSTWYADDAMTEIVYADDAMTEPYQMDD